MCVQVLANASSIPKSSSIISSYVCEVNCLQNLYVIAREGVKFWDKFHEL